MILLTILCQLHFGVNCITGLHTDLDQLVHTEPFLVVMNGLVLYCMNVIDRFGHKINTVHSAGRCR